MNQNWRKFNLFTFFTPYFAGLQLESFLLLSPLSAIKKFLRKFSKKARELRGERSRAKQYQVGQNNINLLLQTNTENHSLLEFLPITKPGVEQLL